MDTTDVAIVLVAAGRGSRAGGDLPKQYRRLAGRPVVARTVAALAEALPQAPIAPVIHPDDAERFAAAVAGVPARLTAPVHGGATRQASVRAGLDALPASTRIVLIHDAARPFCSPALARAAVAAARAHGAAIPGVPVVDALASVDADGRITGAVDRGPLRAAQTPQAFDLALIRDAHARAAAAGRDDFPDDAAVAAFAGAPVFVFPGEAGNVKLTTNDDFSAAEARALMALGDVRVGTGFDVHAFGDGDHVWLGGVKVAHTRAMIGHSDADVLLHALTDALLGALGDGDIGAHFPPSDPRWKGAASDQFLVDACARVAARGGVIAHLDGTVICEAPKVGPHREAIRASVARITGLPIDRVAIKATTTERLGFTGRREGIAAQAVATIRLPFPGA